MIGPRGRGSVWAQIVFGLVLCFGLVRAHPARAAGAASLRQVLSLRPGVTCLELDELVRQLGRWLRDEAIPGQYEFVVEGSAVEPRAARLFVQRGGRTVAQREFAPGPARCSELHAAVALALALAIKASAREESGAAPPAVTAERAPGWAVTVAGLTTYHLLPKLAPGLALAVRRELGEHVSLRLGAFGVAAFGAELEPQGRAYDATLAAARAEACASTRLAASMRGGLCGGVWAGALYAAGARAPGARSAVVSWFALAGAAEVELELSAPWSLELALALALPLHEVRVGLTAADGTPAASEALPPRAWALALGPAYKF